MSEPNPLDKEPGALSRIWGAIASSGIAIDNYVSVKNIWQTMKDDFKEKVGGNNPIRGGIYSIIKSLGKVVVGAIGIAVISTLKGIKKAVVDLTIGGIIQIVKGFYHLKNGEEGAGKEILWGFAKLLGGAALITLIVFGIAMMGAHIPALSALPFVHQAATAMAGAYAKVSLFFDIVAKHMLAVFEWGALATSVMGLLGYGSKKKSAPDEKPEKKSRREKPAVDEELEVKKRSKRENALRWRERNLQSAEDREEAPAQREREKMPERKPASPVRRFSSPSPMQNIISQVNKNAGGAGKFQLSETEKSIEVVGRNPVQAIAQSRDDQIKTLDYQVELPAGTSLKKAQEIVENILSSAEKSGIHIKDHLLIGGEEFHFLRDRNGVHIEENPHDHPRRR